MYKPFDLTGKVALVTGGNSGIGLGMARALAQAGADVAIWGTNAKKNAAAKSELAAGGRKVVALECDVSDEKAVAAAFAETLSKLGRVDGCFANAGVSGRGTASFLEMSSEEWRRVLKVNLDGAFFTFESSPATHTVSNWFSRETRTRRFSSVTVRTPAPRPSSRCGFVGGDAMRS